MNLHVVTPPAGESVGKSFLELEGRVCELAALARAADIAKDAIEDRWLAADAQAEAYRENRRLDFEALHYLVQKVAARADDLRAAYYQAHAEAVI